MNDSEFVFIARLLKERSGLTLTKDKMYLLETRLLPIARRYDFSDVGSLIAEMQRARSESMTGAVVEAMTTNETLFFRDRHPFDAMRDHILPALIARRSDKRALRIWSAACSSGQEPYSIAMLLQDSFPQLKSWRVEIVATDIAPAILARAREGFYSAFEVQRGLPIQLLVKHFNQDGDRWQVKPELRRMVNFQLFNLLGGPNALGTFDIIFCRNVLIYFDPPTKTAVLERINSRLTDDGALILGGAESVFGISSLFAGLPNLRGVYRKTSDNHFKTLATSIPVAAPNRSALAAAS